MSALLDRLDWVLKNRLEFGGSARAWCERAGLSPNYIGTLRTRVRAKKPAGLTVEVATALATAARVPLEWLASGTGDPNGAHEVAWTPSVAAREVFLAGVDDRLSAAAWLAGQPASPGANARRLLAEMESAYDEHLRQLRAAAPLERVVELDADDTPRQRAVRAWLEKVSPAQRQDAANWAQQHLAAYATDHWTEARWKTELKNGWAAARKGEPTVRTGPELQAEEKARGDARRAKLRAAGMQPPGKDTR